MLKNVILGQIQKKLTTKVGFSPDMVIININYLKDVFILECISEKQTRKAEDKISNNDDLSQMLRTQLKKKAKLDNIEIIILSIDFLNKRTLAQVYYKEGNDFKQMEIIDVF